MELDEKISDGSRCALTQNNRGNRPGGFIAVGISEQMVELQLALFFDKTYTISTATNFYSTV